MRRKGRSEAVDDYIAHERPAYTDQIAGDAESAPLFLAGGHAMLREHVKEILATIAREANKNDPNNLIYVSPHMLRHAFGAKHREA